MTQLLYIKQIYSHTVSPICFYLMLQFLFYANVLDSEVIAEKCDGSFAIRTSGL